MTEEGSSLAFLEAKSGIAIWVVGNSSSELHIPHDADTCQLF